MQAAALRCGLAPPVLPAPIGHFSTTELRLLQAHGELLRHAHHGTHEPPVVPLLHLELLHEPLLLRLAQGLAQGARQRAQRGRQPGTRGVLERADEQCPQDLCRARDQVALPRAARRGSRQQPGACCDYPLQRRAVGQRPLRDERLRLLLQLQQLGRCVALAGLGVGPEQHVAQEPEHRAHGLLVDSLVLLHQARHRLDRRVECVREPLRAADRERREVPVAQRLREHLVGRRVDRRRQRRATSQVPRHRRDEEPGEVDEDHVELVTAGEGKEADDGTDEAHVEGLRVLFAASSHELHHGNEHRGRVRIVPREAKDVAECEAHLLHQLLVVRVVDADLLYRLEVLLDDCQHGVVVGLGQLLAARGHVVDARHRRNVELQLQRGLAVARGFHGACAEGLRRQLGEDGRQRLLHARHEYVHKPLQLAPVLQDREHLADAEDQLRAAVHVEPCVRNKVGDRGDDFPPQAATVSHNDALARGRHHHLQSVAGEGLAVLLRVGVRALRQRGDRRQVLQREEAQDPLAGLGVQRQVAGGEEHEPAGGGAEKQRLEALRGVG
mmetsp:Transcript_12915/g.37634  ORF Transcript_12915/g.37634 Transcript_12915/m.37634 type:complete len:555 (+) Transcript_12915:33-1697(+)